MRLFVRVVGVVVAALLALGLVVTGLSAKDYGTLVFWAAPSRIDYCGRRYYPDVRASRAKSAPTWQVIGHTFGLRPIYTTGAVSSAPSSVCTFVVYVGRPSGGYSTYVLSGGP